MTKESLLLFFVPPYFSTKMKTCQPEALLDEGFHGRAALVGSMAFFVAKKSLICKSPSICLLPWLTNDYTKPTMCFWTYIICCFHAFSWNATPTSTSVEDNVVKSWYAKSDINSHGVAVTSVGPNHDDSMTSWTADVISGASQRYKDEPAKVKMLLLFLPNHCRRLTCHWLTIF